jgi:hypothetical protein
LVVLKGQKIPCKRRLDTLKTKKVTIAEDVELPGKSTTVIDVYVERNEADDDETMAAFLVKPTEDFKDRYQLILACTLVDINGAATSKVHVLNPFPVDVKLRQDAVIGKAEMVEKIVSIVTDQDYSSEAENLDKVRRIEVVTKEKMEPEIGLPKAEPTRRCTKSFNRALY